MVPLPLYPSPSHLKKMIPCKLIDDGIQWDTFERYLALNFICLNRAKLSTDKIFIKSQPPKTKHHDEPWIDLLNELLTFEVYWVCQILQKKWGKDKSHQKIIISGCLKIIRDYCDDESFKKLFLKKMEGSFLQRLKEYDPKNQSLKKDQKTKKEPKQKSNDLILKKHLQKILKKNGFQALPKSKTFTSLTGNQKPETFYQEWLKKQQDQFKNPFATLPYEIAKHRTRPDPSGAQFPLINLYLG